MLHYHPTINIYGLHDDEPSKMISKVTQYRIYAGTRKDDFTGWEKVDAECKDGLTLWSLYLGNGYYLDRFIKHVKGFLGSKNVKFTSVRRDNTVEDPDGEYKDMDYHVLFDVDIMVANDSIKFNGKNNSFIVLSREPVDWEQFKSDSYRAEEPEGPEENWSSFYS